MSSLDGLLAALQILSFSREELQEVFRTYEYLELFKPPVVNGWFVPAYKSLLKGGLVLLPSKDEDGLPRARIISRLGRSSGQWVVHLEDGSTVDSDTELMKLTTANVDEKTANALLLDIKTSSPDGSRRPITLDQCLEVAERRIQMNKCAEPVRRLMAIQREAQTLEGDLSWAYRPESRVAVPSPVAESSSPTDEVGYSGSKADPPGTEGVNLEVEMQAAVPNPAPEGPRSPPTLTQMWDETVSLASQIAMLLRKRLSREEQAEVERALRHICEVHVEEAAAVAAGAGPAPEEAVTVAATA